MNEYEPLVSIRFKHHSSGLSILFQSYPKQFDDFQSFLYLVTKLFNQFKLNYKTTYQ